MLNFTPQLRDLSFVIHEVLGAASALQSMPRYKDVDVETLDSVIEEAGYFAAKRILPVNAPADQFGCNWQDGQVKTSPGFANAWHAYCDLGWPSVCADSEHGGQELPRLVFSAVNELIASASHAFVMITAVNHCSSACLRHSASNELQKYWLPRLASGEVLSSMCMTEPQAGSDLGMLTTRAVAESDGSYQITGTKIFASGAEHDLTPNIMHLVLARLPGAPPGSRGVSLFLVPKIGADGKHNRVYCDGIEHKMGLHGSPTCTLRFEKAQGWLVGELNAGLHALFPMMNEARLLSGLQAIGISEVALQNAQAYALERRQGRSSKTKQPCTLIEHVDVQRMLLTQKAWTEGARAIAHWTALLIDEAEWHSDPTVCAEANELLGLLTPIVKGFLSENAQQSAYLALQVYGGHGYVTETGIDQLARDVRITTIYEGTTGIQAQDLFMRKIASDAGLRLKILEDRVLQWLQGPGSTPHLDEFTRPLRALRHIVRAVTDELLKREQHNPGDALSACTNYLRLLGHFVLAWQWARMAAAALAPAHRNDNWYALKVETARFYYTQLLPETVALERAIMSPSHDESVFLAAVKI